MMVDTSPPKIVCRYQRTDTLATLVRWYGRPYLQMQRD